MKQIASYLILVCLAGCSLSGQSQNTNNQPTGLTGKDEVLMTVGKEKVIKHADGSLKMSADVLAVIYLTNEVTADELMKDKTVEITGKVDRIAKDIFNSMYSTFKTKNYSLPTVQCMFDDSQKNSVIHMVPGQTKTIKGICKGKTLGIVLLRESSIIE